MTTFQRELAEMEKIGGIRICPVEAQDGTLYMDKFIESMDKIRAANANVKKRFSLEGVIAFLAVAGVVMLLTYWAVEGF